MVNLTLVQCIKISENLINIKSAVHSALVNFFNAKIITQMNGGSNDLLNIAIVYHTMTMLSFPFSRYNYQNSLLNKTMKQEYPLLGMIFI